MICAPTHVATTESTQLISVSCYTHLSHLSTLPILKAATSPFIEKFHLASQAVPWLRQSVTGLRPCGPRCNPRPLHMGFVVNKVTLGWAFSKNFGFLIIIIPQMLYIHSSITDATQL